MPRGTRYARRASPSRTHRSGQIASWRLRSRAGWAAWARDRSSNESALSSAGRGAIRGSSRQSLGRISNASTRSFLRRYRSIPCKRHPRLSAPARSHRMSPWIHPPWMNHVALRLGANNLHKRKKVFPHYLCCGARMRAPVGDPGTSLGENAYSRHEGKFSLAAGEHLYLSVRRG